MIIKHCHKRIAALLLAALVICLCGVFSACTSAQARTSALNMTDSVSGIQADSTADIYSRWLNENYSSGVYTRADWLFDMMKSLDLLPSGIRPADSGALYKAARGKGIIDEDDSGAFIALTRGYAASTIVKALSYPEREVAPVADAVKGDDIMTLAYYGYFVPDDDDMLHPEALVADGEYMGLLEELRRYTYLKGKSLLSFGDSIMFGAGSGGHGLAEVIAEKYGMTAKDHSVSGATFGIFTGRSHIADQIKYAVNAGDTADLIMINGGTNDAIHVSKGKISDSTQLKDFDEKTFAGGMEYAMALLEKYYSDTPVLYIRAHNMVLYDDEKEPDYGVTALKIAKKWSVPIVDIYEDTDFNTEDEYLSEKYTLYREEFLRSDSIHPTALGYAKYYLPLVCSAAASLL